MTPMTKNDIKPPLNVVNVTIFAGLPVAALVLVPLWGFYHGFDTFQWLWALAFLYLNGMSITGGYHRLWAHKSYEASPALKWFFAFWGAGALQNSIMVWASDHRRHHRHVDDRDLDPYSAKRGLWFSHMGWMLRDYSGSKTDFSNAADLQRDSVVVWQDKHYLALTLLMNLGLPLLLGIWHGDIIGTVLLVGGLIAVLLFSSARPWRSLSIKNHAMRVLDGLQGLTNVSSLFGDALSYLRLFALGLASAKLSETFNGLGAAAWDNAGFGVIAAIAIVILGHTLNLLLSIMSGVVHGLRLNCIEFFKWSLPDEGYSFTAFAKKAKQP